MPLDNRTCFTVNLRDYLACRSCGKTPAVKENYHRGFEYHHVVPRSSGGSDDPENIALLCHACHAAAHRAYVAKNWDLTPLKAFPCHACAATLHTETVAMNCGWYLCGACGARTHLFTHCLGAKKESGS